MRFRTKLFLACVLLVMVVYISNLWPVHNTISASFREVAQTAFSGTKQSLHGMEAEQISRMRQACELLMNIPDLRALIAEEGSELTADNSASLQERLNSLSKVVSVQSIFVLDSRATLVAQSERSPWHSLPRLHEYIAESPEAHSLVLKLFQVGNAGGNSASAAQEGIWLYDDQLYQVVGVPLTFRGSGDDAQAEVEGALIMVTPLTDALALELAKRHNCAVSFVVGSNVIASSLEPSKRRELSAKLAAGTRAPGADYQIELGGTSFYSSFEPLVDACSGIAVGRTLVQASLAEGSIVQRALWRDLAGIGLVTMVLAGIASFLLSTAVTRPVRVLLQAVRQVGAGKLDVSIRSKSSGEMGELAEAFNQMVVQLQSRQELERQVQASREASRAKGQFLANMSHEIRTPLNGVLGVIDLLQTTPLNEKQKRYAGLIQTSAKILSAVINDVLDFSKIEAGKIELESQDFELEPAVGEIIELLRTKSAAKKLELVSQFNPGLPRMVRGDAKRLQQILINLVNNAVKFTERGAITITVMPVAGERAGLVRFEVHDTGIGIPADRIHRLFQSFSQVDASTTRKYGGTGLGLAICKQLAELMGGAIGVTSEDGRGSTFWFTIVLEPASEASASTVAGVVSNRQQQLSAAESEGRKQFRILLAEDNDINQIVTRETVESAGYQCDVVGDGRQALAAAVSGKYDLVLMDCQMPVLDGLAATQAIRRYERGEGPKHSAGKHLPIVALTASALANDREDCLAAGMDAHCVKPLDKAELIRTMDSLLISDGRSSASGGAAPAKVADVSAARVVDRETLDGPPIRLPALLARCMGKEELVVEILGKFEQQAAASMDKLQRHFRAAEADQLARVAHTLKGTASLMSADAVTKLASELEQVAIKRDFGAMEEQLASLAQEVQRCTQFISSTPGPLMPTASAEPLTPGPNG